MLIIGNQNISFHYNYKLLVILKLIRRLTRKGAVEVWNVENPNLDPNVFQIYNKKKDLDQEDELPVDEKNSSEETCDNLKMILFKKHKCSYKN